MKTSIFGINAIVIVIFTLFSFICNYLIIINAKSTRQKRHALEQINENIFYTTLYALASTGIIILFY